MRVPINLASRPYENLRPVYNAAGLAAILLVALALVVAWADWQNRRDTRLLTEQVSQLEAAMADLAREQLELEQGLRRPEMQEIRERSAFLNSLIVRKSLSWTQMFMDLETILPPAYAGRKTATGGTATAVEQLEWSLVSTQGQDLGIQIRCR